PARRPRPSSDRDLRVHPGLERVHRRLCPALQPQQSDTHDLAGFVHDEPRSAVGAAHGRRDVDRRSGGGLFPSPPALSGRRPDRGRGQGMSKTEDLILRCLLPGFAGASAPDWVLGRVASGLGGVVLYGRNVEDRAQLAALNKELHAERPELVVSIDEEGGDVTRLEAATGSSYPGNLALGAAGDVDLTRSVARAIGLELARAGVDLDLAPDADVNSNPSNPVTGVRSFGSEPGAVAAQTAAWVEGLQSAGVAACVKHFPGHGDTSVDSHIALPVVGADPRAGALQPFEAAIAAGVQAVMSAHIIAPSLDRVPATVSRAIMTGLLRDELGFRGLAVTDGLEMKAIADISEGAVQALAA